jgi:hypothetical protein
MTLIDESEIRRHLAIVCDHVAKLAIGIDRPGVLQLTVIHPLADGVSVSRFKIGDVDGMTKLAIVSAESGHNIFIDPRTVPADCKGRGTADDSVFVFALWLDDDGALARDVPASLIIETSPGHRHLWILLDRPIGAAEAKELGARLRAYAAGADPNATGSMTSPPRVAGTVNHPTRSKIAYMRQPVPVRILEFTNRSFSPDELRQLFPAIAPEAIDDSDSIDRVVTKRDLLDCAAALKWIPADDYEEWKNIGLALAWAARRAESATLSESFGELFDKWSALTTRQNYNRHSQWRAWNNFLKRREKTTDRGPKTIFGVYSMASGFGWPRPVRTYPGGTIPCMGSWNDFSADQVAAILIEDRKATKKEALPSGSKEAPSKLNV